MAPQQVTLKVRQVRRGLPTPDIHFQAVKSGFGVCASCFRMFQPYRPPITIVGEKEALLFEYMFSRG